jgi:hypothetical protein
MLNMATAPGLHNRETAHYRRVEIVITLTR